MAFCEYAQLQLRAHLDGETLFLQYQIYTGSFFQKKKPPLSTVTVHALVTSNILVWVVGTNSKVPNSLLAGFPSVHETGVSSARGATHTFLLSGAILGKACLYRNLPKREFNRDISLFFCLSGGIFPVFKSSGKFFFFFLHFFSSGMNCYDDQNMSKSCKRHYCLACVCRKGVGLRTAYACSEAVKESSCV